MELIVRWGERQERVRVERRDGLYQVEMGERTYAVDVAATGPFVRTLLLEGRQFELSVRRLEDGRYRVGAGALDREVEVLEPLAHLAQKAMGEVAATGLTRVTAYMPGRVVEILVEEGDEVEAGQGLVVLEAMKMENEIQADGKGTVRRILVQAGQAVDGGDLILEIE